MSDELSFFTQQQQQQHRASLSSASSAILSANSPISPSLADSNTPPEILFDYNSPTIAGLNSLNYPDEEHALLAHRQHNHHHDQNGILSTQPTDPRYRQPVLLPNTPTHTLNQDPAVLGTISAPPLTADGVPVKRPRGRPRKHPVVQVPTIPKGQKGARSKTGCGTCRRRKKKCDETKPICLNCQKYAVRCEGYRPPEHWKAGAKKSNKRSKSDSTDSPSAPDQSRAPSLPSMMHGVETDIDRIMLEHMQTDGSRVFAPWHDKPSAFRDLMMPLAVRDKGVMHSLLSLSGSHLMNKDPSLEIEQRTAYHESEAISSMTNDPALTGGHVCDPDIEANPVLAARAILLCFKASVTGEVRQLEGHRMHWKAIKHITRECPCRYSDADFQNFVNDFASFHSISQAVTSLDLDNGMVTRPSNFVVPAFVSPAAGAFFGMFDSLFMAISKVTELRAHIRANRTENMIPTLDVRDLEHAKTLESDLREWICNQPRDSHQWVAAHLYRVCIWIYLTRTISPSQPSGNLRRGVEEGLGHLATLLPEPAAQGVLLMPLFLIGCAAFDKDHRDRISEAFKALREARACENVLRAYKVVNTIWGLMDAQRPESWDWELVMAEMGWDFLVT